jgi:hypothetical protein
MDVCVSANTRNSHNIFPEKIELQFYQAFCSLKLLGCDYFYFLGLDGGVTYRFCTHDNWIDFYHDEKFIAYDPLKRIIENIPFMVLPWEQVTHLHANEKKTMYGRISFGLFNGLTIARESHKRKYVFALATESKEHDLARYLLLEKIDKLEKVIYDFIRLFDQYLVLMYTPLAQMM